MRGYAYPAPVFAIAVRPGEPSPSWSTAWTPLQLAGHGSLSGSPIMPPSTTAPRSSMSTAPGSAEVTVAIASMVGIAGLVQIALGNSVP